jgi:hypothetical protein
MTIQPQAPCPRTPSQYGPPLGSPDPDGKDAA